jgi:hypothetical protein
MFAKRQSLARFRQALLRSVGSSRWIEAEQLLQLCVWSAQDHIEGQQATLVQVAVPWQGVDGQDLEGIVEK